MIKESYPITPAELVFLLGLLEIEPLPQTVLAAWLGSVNYDLLADNDPPSPAKTLLQKGWIWYDDQNWHLADRLANSLELIARATTTLTLHVQKDGIVADSDYAQYQDQCCRYLLDDKQFTIYPPESIQEIALSLLPEETQPAGQLAFRQEIDLASLFVLNEACWQTARAVVFGAGESGFTSQDLISGLEDSFVEPASRSWQGLELAVDLERLSLHSVIQDLINQDLLQSLPGGRLTLTVKSDPYNLIISDPEMFALSCSFYNNLSGEVELASWLFGSGEILQIEAVGDGLFQLNTIFSAQIIEEWIRDVSKKFEKAEPPSALAEAPASRKILGGGQKRSRGKAPWFVRLLRGLAGAVLSTLVIGTLSSAIVGLIQGDLALSELTSQLGAGIQALASEVNLQLPGQADSPDGEGSKDPSGAEAGQDASREDDPGPAVSEEELGAALAAIQVVESRIVQDGYQEWYAVAILQNASQLPLSRVMLEVQIKNAGGELLYSETGYTRSSFPPGENTNLDHFLAGFDGGSGDLKLEIIPINAEPLLADHFVPIELADLQLHVSGYNDGYWTILGEMVNPSDQLVTLEVGALLRDEAGQLSAGRHSSALQNLLLPGERVPFSINFKPLEPGQDLSLEDSLELFAAGRIADSSTREPEIRLSSEQGTFVDQSGLFHIVGKLQNGEAGNRDLRLIGAVYDGNGRLVDACTHWLHPRGLPSGAELPFDIGCWFMLDDLDQEPALRERAVTYEVMVERQSGLRESQSAAVPIEIGEVSAQVESRYIQFSAALAADIPEGKENGILILTLTDSQDGRILAVYRSWPDLEAGVFRGEGILPEGISELGPEIEISAQAYAY